MSRGRSRRAAKSRTPRKPPPAAASLASDAWHYLYALDEQPDRLNDPTDALGSIVPVIVTTDLEPHDD